MLSNAGYAADFDLDLSYDDTEEFIICSCGHYKLLSLPRLDTKRPKGRNDWQIIYMKEGCGHFILKGEEQLVEKENMILYRPGECQQYFYLLEEEPELYWIHFSGFGCRRLLEELGFDKSICFVGKPERYQKIFEHIILELQLKGPGFSILCAGYGRELLVKMSREAFRAEAPELSPDPYMNRIVLDMYREYKENITIEEYAHRYHMSVSWLIRRFRACFGETPQQYIIKIRMEQAGNLLISTSLSIGEIASFSGYDNPLYFSRIFKKMKGVSPTQYRQQAEPDDKPQKL